MKISMIACVGKNLELGKDNDLIWRFSTDLKRFKALTIGHVVVMGKNTYKSLSKPLRDRKNVVLTTSDDKFPGDVEVYSNIEDFLEKYKDHKEEIFIIGGASIYKQFLEYADTLYLTEVDSESEADVYFPSFNKKEYKKEIVGGNDNYQFAIYRREFKND